MCKYAAEKIREAVDKKGGSLEKALEGAYIILCADGAVHPRLQQGDCNIITYSMTLSSYWLIKECGLYPTSGNSILPHV